MTGELDAPHREQLHKVAQMEARCRRVESAVEGDGITGQESLQLGWIGGHMHKATPGELVPDVADRRVIPLRLEP